MSGKEPNRGSIVKNAGETNMTKTEGYTLVGIMLAITYMLL